jgi:hypothetical protein
MPLAWAVASAGSSWSTEASARARASEPAATSTKTATAAGTAEAAWSRTAVPAWRPRRTSGASLLAGSRLADRQRTPHQELSIQFADGLFGGASFRELDEREPAGTAGFAIERTNDLSGLTELRKVRTQIFFGCLIGQVTDKQSDWWHGLNSGGWKV